MTERDWLTSTDPQAMLTFLRRDFDATDPTGISDRKLRLFALANWRAWREGNDSTANAERIYCDCLEWVDGAPRPAIVDQWSIMSMSPAEAAKRSIEICPLPQTAAMLRDIAGNPFQPVISQYGKSPVITGIFHPAGILLDCWLTPEVLAVARTIYDERRFGDMPILADALEEAGCTDKEILNHCRGLELRHDGTPTGDPWYWAPVGRRASHPESSPGILDVVASAPLHVRGCWVVDLILGKE